MRYKTFILTFISFLSLFFVSNQALAGEDTSGLFAGIPCVQSVTEVNSGSNVDNWNANSTAGESSNCTLCHLLQLFVNAAGMLLGLSGVMAFFMFVWGGTILIFSHGNDKQVGWGKETMTNAIIGLLLVMLAWIFVAFIVNTVFAPQVKDAGSWQWNVINSQLCESTPAVSGGAH